MMKLQSALQGGKFWTGIRVLMPIIDDISGTLRVNKYEFMRQKLNINSPRLVWIMFRNILLHKDEVGVLVYGSKKIGWSIAFNLGHSFHAGHIRIDINKLFEDLNSYLEETISSKQDKKIWVQHGVRVVYPPRKLKEEINEIS